jgi:hypothetical protein
MTEDDDNEWDVVPPGEALWIAVAWMFGASGAALVIWGLAQLF